MYEFLEFRTLDVMTRDPVTVAPETTLAEAHALFEEHGWNGLPVVSADGGMLGFVTKLDLLRAFEFSEDYVFPPYEEIMRRPVATVMSRDVATVRPRTPLTRVLHKLVDRRSKSMPVVDDGRVVGIVSREDVLRGLERAVTGEKPSSPL